MDNVVILDWFTPFSVQLPRLVNLLANKFHFVMSHWRRMHFKVRHSTLQPVLLSRRRQKKPTCLEAGVKLCGTDGQLVWRFYLFVQNVLKSFTRRPQERKHLEDGRIVLRLDCREYDTKAGRIAIDEFGVEAPTTSLFAHIALHYFSPYRPTYRILSGAM